MARANVAVIDQFINCIRTVSQTSSLRSLVLEDPQAFSRNRKISFEVVTYLILSMLKKSLNVELNQFFTALHLPNAQRFTKGAFSQRRYQIKSGWFKYLLEYLGQTFYHSADTVILWKGYKLLAIDGSSVFLMNTPCIRANYQGARNKYGCYPVAGFVKMYDVLNKITLKAELLPCMGSERTCAYNWVDAIAEDSITLFDRGFPSFTLFYLMQSCEKPKDFIARCKFDFCNTTSLFIKSNKPSEIIKLYADDKARKLLLTFGHKIPPNCFIEVRAEKIKLPNGKVELLLTSIFDKHLLSNKDMQQLYGKRWGIETSIGKDKNLLQLENYSSHLRQGIEQDFYATFITGNIHSIIANKAQYLVDKNSKTGKYAQQINYSASINCLKQYLIHLFYTTKLERLLNKLAATFKQFTEPIRPNRLVPRKLTSKRRYGKHQTQKNYRNNL